MSPYSKKKQRDLYNYVIGLYAPDLKENITLACTRDDPEYLLVVISLLKKQDDAIYHPDKKRILLQQRVSCAQRLCDLFGESEDEYIRS